MISFIVHGVPQSQGSTRAFIPKGWKRPIITGTNKNLKPWRHEVAQVALDAMEKAHVTIIKRPLAVSLMLVCQFPRPKSGKDKGPFKTTAPDSDKLLRAVGDALKGFVYEDDAQIAQASVKKMYGTPGVVIVVSVLEAPV